MVCRRAKTFKLQAPNLVLSHILFGIFDFILAYQWHLYDEILMSIPRKLWKSSVADPDPNPDPPDPHVFGPPGSGSGPTSQRYGSGSCSGSGSGSFNHHAKIVRKTLIPTFL
jgi:hypothetical protein